jgi:hypothetical protein
VILQLARQVPSSQSGPFSGHLILGTNPGGNPDAWIEETIEFYPADWVDRILSNDFWFENFEHEYVHCSYSIKSVMNPFLKYVLNVTDDGLRKIPKSNLAFRRSQGTDSFKKIHNTTLTSAQREASNCQMLCMAKSRRSWVRVPWCGGSGLQVAVFSFADYVLRTL